MDSQQGLLEWHGNIYPTVEAVMLAIKDSIIAGHVSHNDVAFKLYHINHHHNFVQRSITGFEIAVMGTMSSGKSTLINALIGDDLLPVQSLACTSTICTIVDDDVAPYFTGRYRIGSDFSPFQITTENVIRNWNETPDIEEIELYGNLPGIDNTKQGTRLIIVDTPGPNNSSTQSHAELMRTYLEDGNYGVVLYLLNAAHLCTNDDKYTLQQIANELINYPEKQILFVINKADLLTANDDPYLCILSTQSYLKTLGFLEPVIISLKADRALLARKALDGCPMTNEEEFDLRCFLGRKLNKITDTTVLLDGEDIARELIEDLLFDSGVPSLEAELQKMLCTHDMNKTNKGEYLI